MHIIGALNIGGATLVTPALAQYSCWQRNADRRLNFKDPSGAPPLYLCFTGVGSLNQSEQILQSPPPPRTISLLAFLLLLIVPLGAHTKVSLW